MNSPPLVLGPPVRDGKPYAEIAHTAQRSSAFVAIDRLLREAGFAVPGDLCAGSRPGFLLIEHLGSGELPRRRRRADRRALCRSRRTACRHARQALAATAAKPRPASIHDVPPFDRDAMMIEVELLLDWYLPAMPAGRPIEASAQAFADAWNAVLDRLDGTETEPRAARLHSPNIIWRGRRAAATTGSASSISRTR